MAVPCPDPWTGRGGVSLSLRCSLVVDFHPLRGETVHGRQLCSCAVLMESLELSLCPFPQRSIFGDPFGVVAVAGAFSTPALHVQRSLINPLLCPSSTGISFAEWEWGWRVCLPWHLQRAGSALPLLLRGSQLPTCQCQDFSLRRSCQILPLGPSRTKLCSSPLGRIEAVGEADAAPSVTVMSQCPLSCAWGQLIPPVLAALAELVWGVLSFLVLSDGMGSESRALSLCSCSFSWCAGTAVTVQGQLCDTV